jgi:hypothetical protein
LPSRRASLGPLPKATGGTFSFAFDMAGG